MLDVKERKSRVIKTVSQKEDGYYFVSDYGTLRIAVMKSNIVRISFTPESTFEENDGIGIIPHKTLSKVECIQNDEIFELATSQAKITVNAITGQIKLYDSSNTLLLKEREYESREMERFESRIIDTEQEATVKEIHTADGTKKQIQKCSMKIDRSLYHTRWHFDWLETEKLYGLGQVEDGVLNLRGTKQYLYQANMKITIPVLMSTNGYGIVFATGSTAIFNDMDNNSYFYTEADRYMDAYFIVGDTFDKIISGVRYITGKAAMLPLWAYGYVQSQERYETQEEILQVVKEYRNRNLPIDCMVLDWISWKNGLWGQKEMDESRFPDTKAMIDEMHEDGVRFMMSIWPNMNEITGNYKEFKEANLLLPESDTYNAFRLEGRELYWSQIKRKLYPFGVDGWWCDSSEAYTPEWNHVMKPESNQMYSEFYTEITKHIPAYLCNTFGLYHAMSIYEGNRNETDKKRVVNLTRSTSYGSQSYGVITWSGDTSASWKTYREQITAGLNYCVTGMPYWTFDIGAFFVKRGDTWFWNGDYPEGINNKGYKELYTRWFQLGAFMPMFRAHGTDIRRELWAFDEENDHRFYDALIAASRLRYRLLPYIYSCAGAVWHDDQTILRMLAFDFSKDEKACEVKDQFMLGKSIMVCPVTEPMYYDSRSKQLEKKKQREVYLPKGATWYDFWTNESFTGGTTVIVDAPLNQIPLFVRAGSILPMIDETYQCSDDMFHQSITLYVYGNNASTVLYEDRGDGYEYENGEYRRTQLHWDERNGKLVIDSFIGDYQGRDYTLCSVKEIR